MDIVKILEEKGRIQLVDLASLFLPSPAIGTEEEEFDGEECEEDCEECEEDEEECGRNRCRFRDPLILSEVD